MHELSIARALFAQVEQHQPPGAVVRAVNLRVGALQAIEPLAMHLAWTAVTQDTPFAEARLEMEIRPWQLQCLNCDRNWSTDDPFEPCSCGSRRSHVNGSDELDIVSLEVEVTPTLKDS